MSNEDDEDDIERSESGGPIYRHQARERDWTAPQHATEHLAEVEAHVEKYIGKIETVFESGAFAVTELCVLFAF